jgi:2-polyprenyl-6-methoxyphenol hydroxylase-like FAD-dependent oxidoreductase
MLKFDAIVVGARCAGATTALFLAKSGLNVLLVDRQRFPSDTISTHLMYANTLAIFKRLGVLEKVEKSGAPRLTHLVDDAEGIVIDGRYLPIEGLDYGLCLRRFKLDGILAQEAQSHAGITFVENTVVQGLLEENGRVVGVKGHSSKNGSKLEARSEIVIGADGRNSTIAKLVNAQYNNFLPSFCGFYYGYFRNVKRQSEPAPVSTYRGRMIFYMFPTDDELHLAAVEFPVEEFAQFRMDAKTNLIKRLMAEPTFEERLRDATLEGVVYGTKDMPIFQRISHGPGWALVGDASYNLDPVFAQGIGDAVRGAELLSGAISRAYRENKPLDSYLGDYESKRNEEVEGMRLATIDFISGLPIKKETLDFLKVVSKDQELCNKYASFASHATSVTEFFSEKNIQEVLAHSPSREVEEEGSKQRRTRNSV